MTGAASTGGIVVGSWSFWVIGISVDVLWAIGALLEGIERYTGAIHRPTIPAGRQTDAGADRGPLPGADATGRGVSLADEANLASCGRLPLDRSARPTPVAFVESGALLRDFARGEKA